MNGLVLWVRVLVWTAVLVGVGSVVAGIAVGSVSRDGERPGIFGPVGTTEHPFVGAGFGIAVSGLFTMVLLLFLAAWARAWAEKNGRDVPR